MILLTRIKWRLGIYMYVLVCLSASSPWAVECELKDFDSARSCSCLPGAVPLAPPLSLPGLSEVAVTSQGKLKLHPKCGKCGGRV